MAVKEIKEYYNEVASQYSEMLAEIKSFEEESKKGLYPPERLEVVKEALQPLKRNYEMLSYIMYLLNMPNKKSKKKAYARRNATLLDCIDKNNTKEGVLAENKQSLCALHSK